MAAFSLILVLGLLQTATAMPPVEMYMNYNIAYAVLPHPGQGAGPFRYLGNVTSTKDCLMACVEVSDMRCYSFVYHTEQLGGVYRGLCYGVVGDPIWSPKAQVNIDSGRVLWPCETDWDCSYNGECMPDGRCRCRAAWSGPRCGQMNLLPADQKSGYHYMEDGRNVSSWGGAVLRDETDGYYHMFLSEMRNHCGINSWTINSQMVHARSKTAYGPYERLEVVRPTFSHEPDAIRGNKGEYVLMWTENHYPTYHLCNCTDGSTDPGCVHPRPMYQTYMSYASTPNGPWTPPVKLFGGLRAPDTNFAAVILPNGTLVGFTRYGRSTPFPFGGTRVHLVTASDWRNPSTYNEHQDDAFPFLPHNGVEDPFMYQDGDGHFHALFHNGYPAWDLDDVGAHAFSDDGLTWAFSGRAYSNIVTFTDGGEFVFSRRERPHLVFAADGYTPVALTTSAQYGGKYGDASYTLLQPIKQ